MEVLPERMLTLPRSEARVESALRTGWLQFTASDGGRSQRRRAIARAVAGDLQALNRAQVVFELLPENSKRPRNFMAWMQAIRAYSLTATCTPVVAVALLLLVQSQGRSVQLWTGASALLGVALLQVAINVFNDIEDYRRLIDLPGTLGGSGMIQKGWWTPAELRVVAWASLFGGAAAGIPAIVQLSGDARWLMVAIALLGGAGVLAYSGSRGGLKYHALGDLAVWLLCGPLLCAGMAGALGFETTPGVLWLGAFFGFLAASLLHVNNLQDMALDRSRGVKTLALIFGFRGSLQFLWVLQASAAASILLGVSFGHLPAFTALGVLVQVALAWPWLRRVHTASGPESAQLTDCRMRAAQIHLASGLGLGAGLTAFWATKGIL